MLNLLDFLVYKTDKTSGNKRISKTKVISLIVFAAFFFFSITLYIINPEVSPNIIASVIAAIIVGLLFAVPVFAIGWLISLFLNRDKSNIYTNTSIKEYENVNRVNIGNNPDYNSNFPCPHDNATRFKNAVITNDSALAEKILSMWNNNNDANYLYAKIIFEGMPPSSVSLKELNNWLQDADNINACDEKLRLWFKNTALQVINLNK